MKMSFRSPNASTGVKEIVEPVTGRFTHHLQLNSTAENDEE
jgi:hypothetical protein